MITITGLTENKYQELVQKARLHCYRYTSSEVKHDEEIGDYDIIFSPEISAYVSTNYGTELSTVHLLALGQHFITLESTDFIRISIV